MAGILERFCDSYMKCRQCGDNGRHRFFLDGTTECTKCGLRELLHEPNQRVSDSFYRANIKEKLVTVCSECGIHLERSEMSGSDIAGHCRSSECSPLPTPNVRSLRWDLRCPECGSWKLVGHEIMRCGNCSWVGYDRKQTKFFIESGYNWKGSNA